MLKLDFNERSDFPNNWLNKVDWKTEELWRYPDRKGLEQSVANFYQLNCNQVFCCNGGDEAIYILFRIIRETRSLILPLPAFSQYTSGITSWKVSAQLIAPKSDLSIDLNRLIETVRQKSNSVIVLTRPNNPTGESIAIENLILILQLAKQNKSWVFVDEAYIEFSDYPSAVSLLQQFNNLVILRTLSKAYGLAGIRAGYLLGTPSIIQHFTERALPFNMPSPSITVASQAFNVEAQNEMQAYVNQIKQNRQQITSRLSDYGIQCLPSQANFILIKLNKNRARFVKQVFNNKNISVRSFSEPYLDECIRMTVPYDTELLNQVIDGVFNPDLLCFDMDGVLINTSDSYDECIRLTAKQLAELEVSTQSIANLRSQGGFNNDWVLTQALIKQSGKNIKIQTIIECFQTFYLGDCGDGLINKETSYISSDFTKTLFSKPLSTAIVTGRPRAEAESGQKLINWHRAALISDDDVAQSKPSPEGIEKLKQQFNARRCWMIGDTPDDIKAACDSDSIAIGIGLKHAEKLYSAGADIVLDSVNQLEELL